MTNKKTIYYLAIYIAIRLFAYFINPGDILNTVISTLVLILTSYLLIKKDNRGWYIITGEIILGGIGEFLSIGSITLRTLLLISFLIIFISNKIKDRQLKSLFKNNEITCYLLSSIYFIVIISAIRGYLLDNNIKLIIADTIPYLFLLYYFPIKEIWSDKKFKELSKNLIITAVIGNTIFIALTFILFSSGTAIIHDGYYIFIRDIAGGKVLIWVIIFSGVF